MKNNLINDISTVAGIYKEIRKARKEGRSVKVESKISVPVVGSVGCGFYDTIEGCTLSKCSSEIVEASQKAFNSLAPEIRRVFSQAPKDGEFVIRAFCWKELLKPVLTAKDSHIAMVEIIKWYIHIKKKYAVSEAESENASKHNIQGTKNNSLKKGTFGTVI